MMLTLTGQLIHSFKSPTGETKEGRQYGGDYKIQVLGELDLPNGESRRDLITLTAHDISKYAEFQGKEISVPVGVFVNGKTASFFIPRGSQPKVVTR